MNKISTNLLELNDIQVEDEKGEDTWVFSSLRKCLCAETVMGLLEVGLDNLSTVDYKDKFEVISRTLKMAKKRIFTLKANSITFDIDTLAQLVAEQYTSSNAYPFENKDGTVYASIHLPTSDEKDAFSDQFERLILRELKERLRKEILEAKLGCSTLEQYTTQLLKPLSTFSTPSFSQNTTTGLKYTLDKPFAFEKQRLHLRPHKEGNDPWLKGHKLTIQVDDIRAFDQQLIDGICTYLQLQQVDEDEIDEVQDTLRIMARKDDSPFAQLRTTFIQESLARIQRTAKVLYLEYLYQAMKARKITNSKKKEGQSLLRSLIERLRDISDYTQQHDDGYYAITYRGTRINLRDVFSRADAFDALPIISEVEGSLGESTDYLQGSKTFVNGLKLKLNGQVHIHGGSGEPAFLYHAALLNPGSPSFQQRETEAMSKAHFHERMLKVALLYYFVFVNMDTLTYKPAADFEREILTVFRTAENEEEKDEALRQLYQKIVLLAPEKLALLREALVEFLDHATIGPSAQQKTLVLSLKKTVLVNDVDSMVTHSIFFQDSVTTNNGKDALKYIAIEGANASQDILCKLPLRLTFEPMYFYETDDAREHFTMTFETAGIQVLPIFLAPFEPGFVTQYQQVFRENNRVVLCYRHRSTIPGDSEQAFMYRFTYLLLAYVFLKLLADSITGYEKRKLFFPLVSLFTLKKAAENQKRKYDDEEFIHSLSKILAHLLAQDYTASSQGLHLHTVLAQGNDFHKLGSALYSLYSNLPRLFKLPQPIEETSSGTIIPRRQLEKLAIIVVSSRKCDLNMKTSNLYQATVYGEVIGIERLADGQIRVATLSTFSINQPSQLIYEQPTALLTQVKACYALGYRHFLYVARAPYSRTLHISDRASSEDLFFMKKEVIQALRQAGPGIKVYPVFCDRYYVVNQRRKGRKRSTVDSLYIDDIGELAHVASDPSRRSLVFLNLFSGASVNPQQIYNGVMSYSTLINVYENDPTYDQYIWSDLLSENIPQSLKGDLVDFITLLHFSRYEKPRELGFKLDPYTRIIGDTSVAKMAVFPHMKGRVRFNILAFLTLVRAVVEKEQ